jgi:hypothetical protein
MSEIQDEAYSEAMDEIERLKKSKNILSDLLYKMEAKSNRQEQLLTRAADALEAVVCALDKTKADALENYDKRLYSALLQETLAICAEIRQKIPATIVAELREAAQ